MALRHIDPRLKEEVAFLCKHFNLPDLKVSVGKIGFGTRMGGRARYAYNGEVYLISGRLTRSRLFAVLHEICHYLQDLRGDLKYYFYSFEDRWRLEREAFLFAYKQYKLLFEEKYGVFRKPKLRTKRKLYKKDWYR